MKIQHLTILALLLSTYLLTAQTETKQATVHMKTKVIVNGVETVKDTTFQTSDLEKAMVITSEMREPSKISSSTILIGDPKTMDLEFTIDSIMKQSGSVPQLQEGSQFIIKKVHCGASKAEIDSVKEFITIRIEKRLDITEATEEEKKQMNKQSGINYHKLELESLNLFPNPGSGKFNLSFSTTKKADTEISIQNIEGKQIYNEKLPSFSGNYKKEIDISQQPKGAYFIRISQGTNAQVKKIIVE